MATQSRNKSLPKVYGPGGTEIAYGSVTLAATTGGIVLNEAEGITGVTRSGSGVFVVQLARTGLKAIVPTLTLLTANGSTQSVTLTSKSLSAGTFTFTQTTTGGTTAVDTANTVEMQIVLRTKA